MPASLLSLRLVLVGIYLVFFARKNQFVFSSFSQSKKCNILCFQQMLEFVSTIFNIFFAPPFPAGAWDSHFLARAFGTLASADSGKN